MIQSILQSHHRIVWYQAKFFFHPVLFCALVLMVSCSNKDELLIVKKDIQQIRTELDSIKLMKEKWQDYEVKGKWVITDTAQKIYETFKPLAIYIKKFEFYDKPYVIYSNYKIEVCTKYEVDYNKIIIYDEGRLRSLGQKPLEQVFLTLHLISKDTLICTTESYKGIYIKKE